MCEDAPYLRWFDINLYGYCVQEGKGSVCWLSLFIVTISDMIPELGIPYNLSPEDSALSVELMKCYPLTTTLRGDQP
jgi:hypothetical protein